MGRRDYLSVMEAQPSCREALVAGGRCYTFGMLVESAWKLRRELKEGGRLQVIKSGRIEEQLVQFLAYSGTGQVPIIVPGDMKLSNEFLEAEIPEQACMSTVTSGTTGGGKLLFRTMESWYDYFPIQNQIFKMGEGSRIFIQGSLAFTGNFNFCLAQLTFGGTIIAEEQFDPRLWLREISRYGADVIYLIPAKLRVLKQACEKMDYENQKVKMLISGSQCLGGSEAVEYTKLFSNAELILYYGASELNYITYVHGSEMTEDKTLIGTPFPGVEVRVERGKILVSTDYGVLGTEKDTFVGDYGHFDHKGLLYFDGRRDDICNINGLKVSAVRVENTLSLLDNVEEAAVKVTEYRGRNILAAWVVIKPGFAEDAERIKKELGKKLTHAEIPKHVVFAESLPKNESGKVLKRKLCGSYDMVNSSMHNR